jgi:hypothetical protein
VPSLARVQKLLNRFGNLASEAVEPGTSGALLLEDGSFLLLESGDKILLE